MKTITKPSKEALRYPVRIEWSDENEGFVATAPDFPSLVCVMDTEKEALSEIRLIITGSIDAMREDGYDLPEPSAVDTLNRARQVMTVTKIADIMGIKRPTLATWIRRGKVPPKEETKRLRKALELV